MSSFTPLPLPQKNFKTAFADAQMAIILSFPIILSCHLFGCGKQDEFCRTVTFSRNHSAYFYTVLVCTRVLFFHSEWTGRLPPMHDGCVVLMAILQHCG
jgi:hypothetical protein